MKRLPLIFCLLFLPYIVQAQSYTYLGVDEGLSHRHVYSISKDSKGYMWFLTYEGADRFNGSEFKHYQFHDENQRLSSPIHLKSLFSTPDSMLWQIGNNGKVFNFDYYKNEFKLFYTYPGDSNNNENINLDFSNVDTRQRIWMGNNGNLHIYDYSKQKPISITQHPLYAATTVEHLYKDAYAIGTTHGVFLATIEQDSLKLNTPNILIDELPMRIEQLYYHKESNSLLIATLRQGLFIYSFEDKELSKQFDLQTTSVNKMTHYTSSEVLIATNGAGIYKLNLDTQVLTPFIIADYDTPNGMNGNSIKDIYIDEENRIWMANYPTGITVLNNQNMNYKWTKHIPSQPQSLVHNEVNTIIEDSEGDLWFATTNGISLYRKKQNRWESYLSSYNNKLAINNHMFISLAEIKPGVVWVGGYNSGIYEVNKHTRSSRLLLSNQLQQINQPDKCIRAILKDTDQSIWVGGYYNLKQINPNDHRIRYYNELRSITTLIEKDTNSIWVGSAKGLFLLDKKSGSTRSIDLPIQSTYVHTLHQDDEGLLYIGTNEGLIIFDVPTGQFEVLNTDNSSLISNAIKSIVKDRASNSVVVATDKGLSKLSTETKKIKNWTKDHGLLSTFFSANAGLQLKNGNFIFGSANGVIEFDRASTLPSTYKTKLILEDLVINQNLILPADETGILSNPLNNTEELVLNSKQNNILIKVGSINYDYPSNILYSWYMYGASEEWSQPSSETTFNFTNLSPGSYSFKVRVIPRDNQGIILDERTIDINIQQPYWWSILAKLAYLVLFSLLIVLIIRYLISRNEKKLVDHTKQFYYNTAHDIKVPLRLIKEPLEELRKKENLSPSGLFNLKLVLRNLNALLAQNDNVINYERMESNKEKLYLSEHNLSHFIQTSIKQITPIAELKQISIHVESSLDKEQTVWLDKDKSKTIISNLLNSAIERSPDFNEITIKTGIIDTQWFIEIKHQGDGVSQEQLNMLSTDKSLDDAIYSDVNIQRELGLRLVIKLVKLHKGSIHLESSEEEGTLFRVNLPVYHKALTPKPQSTLAKLKLPPLSHQSPLNSKGAVINHKILDKHNLNKSGSKPTLLLVEYDKNLQAEIIHQLSEEYIIEVCEKGINALKMAKELRPDIIISRMYLEDIKGTELSLTLKGDIETSHIPIILMTDKSDEKHILKGLQNGADEYILKPFNYRILKASMANLLANRALLRDKYASLEIQKPADCIHCSTDLDWNFIASVKEKVEKHMAESDFNVDKLCSLLNMSRTSFYNKLKALTNKAPSDYIRLIKLNHAANLLKSQEFTIAEIAEKTGFNDAKYFREVFKKHYKMTPSKYAKEHS